MQLASPVNEGWMYERNKKYIKLYKNSKIGLGSAIQNGILRSRKKYVCIFMADMSDDIKDLIKYYYLISFCETIIFHNYLV